MASQEGLFFLGVSLHYYIVCVFEIIIDLEPYLISALNTYMYSFLNTFLIINTAVKVIHYFSSCRWQLYNFVYYLVTFLS